MGAFGTKRGPHLNIRDGHLELKQGAIKSENTLTLFEESGKSLASQKGQHAFGTKRLNVDQVVDSHHYDSDPKVTLLNNPSSFSIFSSNFPSPLFPWLQEACWSISAT